MIDQISTTPFQIYNRLSLKTGYDGPGLLEHNSFLGTSRPDVEYPKQVVAENERQFRWTCWFGI